LTEAQARHSDITHCTFGSAGWISKCGRALVRGQYAEMHPAHSCRRNSLRLGTCICMPRMLLSTKRTLLRSQKTAASQASGPLLSSCAQAWAKQQRTIAGEAYASALAAQHSTVSTDS
jgi:hypothetical protein